MKLINKSFLALAVAIPLMTVACGKKNEPKEIAPQDKKPSQGFDNQQIPQPMPGPGNTSAGNNGGHGPVVTAPSPVVTNPTPVVVTPVGRNERVFIGGNIEVFANNLMVKSYWTNATVFGTPLNYELLDPARALVGEYIKFSNQSAAAPYSTNEALSATLNQFVLNGTRPANSVHMMDGAKEQTSNRMLIINYYDNAQVKTRTLSPFLQACHKNNPNNSVERAQLGFRMTTPFCQATLSGKLWNVAAAFIPFNNTVVVRNLNQYLVVPQNASYAEIVYYEGSGLNAENPASYFVQTATQAIFNSIALTKVQ